METHAHQTLTRRCARALQLTEPPFVDFVDVVAVRDALNFIQIKAQVQILARDIDPFSCAQDRGQDY
jgi:hypothetical protein